MGSGHGGAAEGAIGVARRCAQDLTPRLSQMNGPSAKIRERGEVIGPSRGGDTDDVREIKFAGIGLLVKSGTVVVVTAPATPAVPRRDDKKDAALKMSLDGVKQGLRKASPTPAIVGGDDVYPPVLHELYILQARDRISGTAGAASVEELAGHELYSPVDPDDANAVIADRADSAGHVSSVVIVVHGIIIVIHFVDAVTIIHEAVAIIVQSVAVTIVAVLEHIRREILVVVVDAGIDHGDNNITASRGDVPRLRRIDVRILGATGLSRIVETPERTEVRVIRRNEPLDYIVRLRVEHVQMVQVARDRLLNGHPVGESHELDTLDDLKLPDRR